MRTFNEYIKESEDTELQVFESMIQEELSPEQESKINEALGKFLEKYQMA